MSHWSFQELVGWVPAVSGCYFGYLFGRLYRNVAVIRKEVEKWRRM